MLTISGVCTCNRCERYDKREIYRMVGSCFNCQAEPVLMLFRAGERVEALECPVCRVKAVHAKRFGRRRDPGGRTAVVRLLGQLFCPGCADGTSPEGAAAVAQSVTGAGTCEAVDRG